MMILEIVTSGHEMELWLGVWLNECSEEAVKYIHKSGYTD